VPREQLDLHEEHNPNCERCRNREERRTRDGLCETVPSVTDGFPVRCVGKWARDKIYFLSQYFGIFGNGMKNSWEGKLDYFEICSGPGRCVIREEANEVDGTALAVIHNRHFPHYHGATFFDISEEVVDVLNRRLQPFDLGIRACAMVADYNQSALLAEKARSRSAGGLNLVFVDPTDCSVPFATIAALADSLENVDFIINVAVGTDATRNIKPAILDPESRARAKYSLFLGGDAFFLDDDVVSMAKAGRDEQLRLRFREYYRGSLLSLGYEHFATERVEHYYDLLFASRHPKGLEFWKKAQKYGPDDQAAFDFGEISTT
jgi:three-Cys-motif partner protein